MRRPSDQLYDAPSSMGAWKRSKFVKRSVAPSEGSARGRPPDAQQCRSRDLVRKLCYFGPEFGANRPPIGVGGEGGLHHKILGNQQVRNAGRTGYGALPLPQSSHVARSSSFKHGHLHQPRYHLSGYAWRRSPGASFQNLILSKYHTSTASSLGAQSFLWSPVKLWVVTQFKETSSRLAIARILSKCSGDGPDCIKVCTFGPHIFTFRVANANVAAELLIRGKFKADSVSFVIVPSFRKAFNMTPSSLSAEQFATDAVHNSSDLLESPHLLTWQTNRLQELIRFTLVSLPYLFFIKKIGQKHYHSLR
jgi:hypothetical protein